MNKKDYSKIIQELNERLNTKKFNFQKCGGVFGTSLGKVEVYLHGYDEKENIYSVFIKFNDIEKLKENGIFHYNEYSGKANIYSSDIGYVLNMIAYYIF